MICDIRVGLKGDMKARKNEGLFFLFGSTGIHLPTCYSAEDEGKGEKSKRSRDERLFSAWY